MPLATVAYKEEIKSFLLEFLNNTDETRSTDYWIDRFADKLSKAGETYIKTGLVTTTGTATNHTGNIT